MLNYKNYKYSTIAFYFIVLLSIYFIKWGNSEHPFLMDVDQYYSYLVAQFIHHDFTFHFPHHYWLVETPTQQYIPKVTMGLAFLYLPFFTIGNIIAHVCNYETLGYSAPYYWSIHIGSILYVLIGLWYCRKSLLLFFKEWIVALSLLFVIIGTNLFFYTYKESEMSHGLLFFLFSVFIYHVLKWRQTDKIKHVYYFSFIAGLVTLIRPTEILILLFPLLIYVSNFSQLKSRLIEIINLKWKLIFSLFIFFIPIIPQLIFWKTHTGQFLFFSYGTQEGFFFADPKFYSVLFGWRKGWFIYTPIMILSIIGLLLMFFKRKDLFFSVFIYFVLNLYLICCWWDWGYGGAFGMRALVQCYAFLIIPFAFFLNWSLSKIKKNVLRFILGTITVIYCLFCSYNNVFQTYLMNNSLMHWDSMTKEAYKYTFLTTDVNRVYLETMFKHPNYKEMRKGNRDE